jgi:hypothetical protein
MNMRRLSELDPDWIVERYHGADSMKQFVDCLHDYGVPRDDGTIIWKIIDAEADAELSSKERHE